MTEWWEVAYKGGPMVALPGFPRPLYPADASQHGKRPSAPGPDVEAYKRTVSRAGRWEWQAFDDAYSNAFAHGKGPNVIDTGIAGVQRQQDIDDTGWIGKATFNTLRSIRVPEGKPHAGEMCMDATAQSLLKEAWGMFGGHEPSAPASDLRSAALAKAVAEIGTKESPADSNQCPYTSWYGMTGPWCAMFMCWAWCQAAGGNVGPWVRGSRYAYVPYIVSDARAGKYGLRTTDAPIPGDLVCYDWAFDGEFDHVGVFEKWLSASTFQAVEGNTSTSNDSNGGQVMRRQRATSSQATVFVRVPQ